MKPSKATSLVLMPGRNLGVADRVAALLEALGLHVARWSDAAVPADGPVHAGTAADQALERAQAVVALLTGDAPGALHRSLLVSPADEEGQVAAGPTPEFLLELGETLGRMSGPEEDRLVLVRVGESRVPASLERRGILDLDGTARAVQELVLRLRDAGCRIAPGAAAEAARVAKVEAPSLPVPVFVDAGDPSAAWTPRAAAYFRLGAVAAPPPATARAPGIGAASNPLEAMALLLREVGLDREPKVAELLRSSAKLDAELRADPNATSDASEFAAMFSRAERVVSNAVADAADRREAWAFRLGALLTLVLRHAPVDPAPCSPALLAALGTLDDHIAAAPLSTSLARALRRFLVAASREAVREALAMEGEAIEGMIVLAAKA